MYIHIYIHIYISRNCLHCTFPFFCTDQQCAGPSYSCIARIFMERQFGRDSRTCMNASYLRLQLHGDARTGRGAPLARNCTETYPNKVTAWQPCHHAKHTNNTLVQRLGQFCRHCSASSERAWICTDRNSLKPPLQGVARTGCGPPLHRAAQTCMEARMHGLARKSATGLFKSQTCMDACNCLFQFTVLHITARKLPNIYIYIYIPEWPIGAWPIRAQVGPQWSGPQGSRGPIKAWPTRAQVGLQGPGLPGARVA